MAIKKKLRNNGKKIKFAETKCSTHVDINNNKNICDFIIFMACGMAEMRHFFRCFVCASRFFSLLARLLVNTENYFHSAAMALTTTAAPSVAIAVDAVAVDVLYYRLLLLFPYGFLFFPPVVGCRLHE